VDTLEVWHGGVRLNGKYHIAYEADNESGGRCDCCGSYSRTVWGFVERDEHPFAVYYAGRADDHTPGDVDVLFSWGGWGKGATTTKRFCGVQIYLEEARVLCQTADVAELPGFSASAEGFLGEELSSDAAKALKSEWLDAFQAVLMQDSRVNKMVWEGYAP
jgi:hypothetical protein